MLRFEFLCVSYRCYKGHVSKLTEKSSCIDSNKSATVNELFQKNLYTIKYFEERKNYQNYYQATHQSHLHDPKEETR